MTENCSLSPGIVSSSSPPPGFLYYFYSFVFSFPYFVSLVVLKTVHSASLSKCESRGFPRSERKAKKRPKKVDALFFFFFYFFFLLFFVVVFITINVINFI